MNQRDILYMYCMLDIYCMQVARLKIVNSLAIPGQRVSWKPYTLNGSHQNKRFLARLVLCKGIPYGKGSTFCTCSAMPCAAVKKHPAKCNMSLIGARIEAWH